MRAFISDTCRQYATAFALCALTLTGCAPSATVQLDPGVKAAATGPFKDPGATGYARLVDGPIGVRDTAGRMYQHPFLGGFNVPRPQLIDIDADGDLDLFIQEERGKVMFFENLSLTGSAMFAYRTHQYAGIDVGEWYRFADLDGDGDPDLLAEQPFSYVRYLENRGKPGAPMFAEAADSLKDANGDPIFSDRQNIPNVTDIDCDDKPDLFIGRLEGTVTRYEWADAPGGVPRFRFMQDRFEGIEIIGQVLGSLHGANTLSFADTDGDGDQDLLWGDYFEPGLLLVENTGTCERIAMDAQPVPFPPNNPVKTSGYNAPAPGDIDGDGDIDLLVGVLGGAFNANTTTAENLLHLEQTTPGSFELRTRRFIYTVDIGAESIPAIGDLDGDGDLDLLLSNQIEPNDNETSGAYLFEMRSGVHGRYWQLADTLRFHPAYHYAPALGDLDADGDPDMVLGTWRDELTWHRNRSIQGAVDFEPVEGVVAKLTRGSNATPALVDIDADGDLDLFVGETSGTINFYRNEGTPREPRFVFVSDEYAGIDVGRRSFPVFVDVDNDGDYDLVSGRAEGGVAVYRNEGTPVDAKYVEVDPATAKGVFASVVALDLPPYSTPVFVDLDGDRDLDVISGGEGGGIVYRERR